MQTKKRAKSVTFGKKKEKPEEKISPEIVQQIISNAAKAEEPTPEPEKAESLPKNEEKETEKPEEKATVSVEESVVEVVSVTEEPKAASQPEVEAEVEKEAKPDEKPEVASDAPQNSLEESLESLQSQTTPQEQAPQPVETEQQQNEPQQEEASDVPSSSFFAQNPINKTHSRRKKGHILYFLGVAFVSFILGLGVMWGATYGLKSLPNLKFDTLWFAAKQEPTPTPTPEISPEPTEPAKEVDLSAHSIQVLNGSGISGKAAKLKASLVEAGFTVSSTGNADASDYTKTQIRAKKTVSEDFLNKLEAELKKDYVLDAKEGTPPTGTADVIVIIGSEEAK